VLLQTLAERQHGRSGVVPQEGEDSRQVADGRLSSSRFPFGKARCVASQSMSHILLVKPEFETPSLKTVA
jgi:hypothetical protein